jgi:L-fucose mutarotase
MIYGDILHPELLDVLGRAGHGAQIVIADGNFPFSTMAALHVPRVYLNLAPDKLTVPEVLEAVVKVVPLEGAIAPVPDDKSEPPIWKDYRRLLPDGLEIKPVTRFPFYDAVKSPDTAVVIATGETRIYSCIILVLGVR